MDHERGVDVGMYTSVGVLREKLQQREPGTRSEATWNMRRFPVRLGKGTGPDRLFFAHDGFWRGFFEIVPEVLFNPRDQERPYSLIFDLNSWRAIEPMPVKRFRGFRYLEDMPE